VNWDGVLFGLSGAIALVGAVLAVGLRNIFHNILGFALALVGVAGLFLTLGSDFLAAVLILVYVGALAIAMVYAVMLSYPLDTKAQPRRAPKVAGAAVLAMLVAAALYLMVLPAHFPPQVGHLEVTAEWSGRRLLKDYALGFELISVLLVVAMIGAVMVARKARMPKEPLKVTPPVIG
jgi:NADH:ubiquinone oxidoreductase subunit 6 (subunit J)